MPNDPKTSNGVIFGAHNSHTSIGNPLSLGIPSTESKIFAIMFNRYICEKEDKDPPYIDPCKETKEDLKNNGNTIDRVYTCLPIVTYPNVFNDFQNSDFPVLTTNVAHLTGLYYPNASLSFNVNPCASNFDELNLSRHFFLSSHSIMATKDNFSVTDSVAHRFSLFSALVSVYCDKHKISLNNIPTKKLMLLQKEVAPFNNLANWRGTTHSLAWDELMDMLLSTDVLTVEHSANNGSFTKTGKWPIVPLILDLNYYSKTLEITLLIKLQYNTQFNGYNYPNTGVVGIIENNCGIPACGTTFLPTTSSSSRYNSDPPVDPEEPDC
jgi:hypothetical protein